MLEFEEVKNLENQIRALLNTIDKTHPQLTQDYNKILDQYIGIYIDLGKEEIQSNPGYTKEILKRLEDLKLILERFIKIHNLREIIRKEIKTYLNEEYIDKFKFRGKLITNIKSRNQHEILSDIRSLPGVTIVSTTELKDYSHQNFNHFATILNIKLDGYPYMKTGFNRNTIEKIADNIRKVPDVVSFQYSDESVETL